MTVWHSSSLTAKRAPAFDGTDAPQWCVQKKHASRSPYEGYVKSALGVSA
jgi:hypothetical protein